MINNQEFSDRLRKIMGYYQLSAAAFADRIQVPRSSISHLLSGRNKPSLDFVMKVVKEFNEVELYWLLNGKGSFPLESEIPLKVESEISAPHSISELEDLNKGSFAKKIERIVLFYDDGTFKEYIK